MNKLRPDLSIIIISFNTRELLREMLDSLSHSLVNSRLKFEVWVVDNASTDETDTMVKKKFPQVKYIQNEKNLGFAYANNQAIRKACGRYVLLLNSDTKIAPVTIDHMVNFMDQHEEVGVSTCRVNLADGSIDQACHRGFPTPWASLTYFLGLEKMFPKVKLFSGYHLYYLGLNKAHEIDSPSGAFYLVRQSVIEKVGMLDEGYFMYGEDLDWSYRIKKAGWKIMYVPDVTIIHYKKGSGRKSISKDTQKKATEAFYETMKIFYQKHWSNKYPQIMTWFVFLLIDWAKIFSLSRYK